MRIACSSKSRLARGLRGALAPVSFAALLAGCVESPRAPSHTLMEWVYATGSCAENHVGQAFSGDGQFVRWLNNDTGQESLYGSAFNQEKPSFPMEGAELDAWIKATTEEILREMMGEDRRKVPREYERPHMVVFGDIPPATFKSNEWVVVGESEHIPPGDGQIYGYTTTCTLTVRERRTEMPSTEERQQLQARWRP